MTFTEKLDLLMKEWKLNKNSLSKACGIPYTTIDGWYKKGCSDLKISTLKKLTAYFGKSLDYWLEDENVQKENSPAPEGAERVPVITKEQSDRLFDALISSGIIRDDDFAPEDIQFLGHIIDVILDWFSGKKS